MEYKKITAEDIAGKGVVGQADTPLLSALEMQNKVEEVPRAVIIPHFNSLIDSLGKRDADVDTALSDRYTKTETDKAIGDKLTEIGAGDMQKAVYDTDGDGVVDNAAKLGGKTPGQLTFGADQIITDEATDKRLPQTLEEKMDKSGGKFTGAVDIATMINLVGDSWNAFTYKSTDGKTRGSIMISNNNRIHFNQQQTGSEFEERYQLPELTAGLTADVWYTIITSKGGTFTGNVTANTDNKSGNYVRNINVTNSAGTSVSTDRLFCYRK